MPAAKRTLSRSESYSRRWRHNRSAKNVSDITETPIKFRCCNFSQIAAAPSHIIGHCVYMCHVLRCYIWLRCQLLAYWVVHFPALFGISRVTGCHSGLLRVNPNYVGSGIKLCSPDNSRQLLSVGSVMCFHFSRTGAGRFYV